MQEKETSLDAQPLSDQEAEKIVGGTGPAPMPEEETQSANTAYEGDE